MINNVNAHTNASGVWRANNKPSAMNIWKVEKPEVQKTGALSAAAQSYLEELKKKFGNVDFIIADYSTDDEAQKLLRQGTGEYNCLITPALLEEMAADEGVRDKYEGVIGDAIGQVDELKETVKETIGEKAEAIQNYGFSVDSEGNVNYYVLLKDGLPGDVNGGSSIVKAGSIEELLKKLDELDLKKSEERRAERRKEWEKPYGDGFGLNIEEFLKDDVARKIRGKNESRRDENLDFLA
ncbi:MAG: DUF6033 family protein [Oscillospiraceae bacterium]|jgi:hypothetical protein|nr:DUF6033 family protein [Oscillospiraceae bacterium]